MKKTSDYILANIFPQTAGGEGIVISHSLVAQEIKPYSVET